MPAKKKTKAKKAASKKTAAKKKPAKKAAKKKPAKKAAKKKPAKKAAKKKPAKKAAKKKPAKKAAKKKPAKKAAKKKPAKKAAKKKPAKKAAKKKPATKKQAKSTSKKTSAKGKKKTGKKGKKGKKQAAGKGAAPALILENQPTLLDEVDAEEDDDIEEAELIAPPPGSIAVVASDGIVAGLANVGSNGSGGNGSHAPAHPVGVPAPALGNASDTPVQVRPHDALIVVDVQNDFCPHGALAVTDGDQVIPVLNRLIPAYSTVVYTRDWHPVDHCSFSADPQYVDMSWPRHCIAATPGAKFHEDLKLRDDGLVIDKGTNPDKEAYSGFQGTDLTIKLRNRGVTAVFVGGLATDYCVKATALDAIKAGFETWVVTDAARAVDVPPGNGEAALQELATAGAHLITSDRIAIS